MRIGITGTTGRLGKALALEARKGAQVIELPRADLDLLDHTQLESKLDALNLDVLLNPAAITAVDACEGAGEDRAYQVNAVAPGILARWAARRRVRFVHFSTDYVFSGAEAGLRRETETPQPIQVYGKTKLAGEQEVLQASLSHLVLRVSWVFGAEKDSFLESAIRRAKAQDNAGAIADKWSLPLFTKEAVPAILELVEHEKARGVVHLAQSGNPCSWLDWAQVAIDVLAENGERFVTPKLVPQSVEEVEFFTAPRPIHTALATDYLNELLGRKLTDWKTVVTDYVTSLKW